jgi:two-component system heavy metal sensor histidine kinase CusS
MFLKHVSTDFKRTGSLKNKLTLFYTLAIFIVVTGIALFLYSAMMHILNKGYIDFFNDEIDVIEYILLTKPNDRMALTQEVQDIPGALQKANYPYYVRVLDANKKLIMETQGANATLYGSDLLFKNNQSLDKPQIYSSAGKKYMLMEFKIPRNPVQKNHQTWYIQVILNASYQHDLLVEYRKLVLIALSLGGLLSIIISHVIVQSSMRRLYELTESTKAITTKSLDQRIDPTSWPKELRELGIAFNHMLDRIEMAFLRLKQFSSDLAHELRTPISSLIGEMEVALLKTATHQEYREVLESNLEEAQRIAHIIENLLFLASAENPQLEIKKDLIGITTTGQAKLFANIIMFRRMLSNVLSNSLKYTATGGRICFHIEEINSKVVHIQVSDNGIGIPAEHLPNLLQRFYRVDRARSTTEGIGLGLTIVKSIVDLHLGTLEIKSQYGHGTTLTLQFPK